MYLLHQLRRNTDPQRLTPQLLRMNFCTSTNIPSTLLLCVIRATPVLIMKSCSSNLVPLHSTFRFFLLSYRCLSFRSIRSKILSDVTHMFGSIIENDVTGYSLLCIRKQDTCGATKCYKTLQTKHNFQANGTMLKYIHTSLGLLASLCTILVIVI